jgi:RND family efflux transporter MFP subunit
MKVATNRTREAIIMTNVTAPEPAALAPQSPPLAPDSPDPAAVHNESPSRFGRQIAVITVIAISVFAVAFIVGLLPRLRRDRELKAAAAAVASAKPKVTIAIAREETADSKRVLPGNALPLLEASLFARTTGYVNRRLVDIGDQVEEGQLLAVIDSPEVDDQLVQAKADLNQARATLQQNEANAILAKTTLARFQSIQKENSGAVSPQDIDERVATVNSTVAAVAAAQASIGVNEAAVQRFTDLQGFERITAPFPGRITARNIDAGDLVTADLTARELFHLMRTDILRVFVNVPQSFAASIKVGQTATVYMRDNPTKHYSGKVTRTADALDPGSRTLLTEVQVPNPDNSLRPGMYLQVQFDFARDVDPLMIPTAALATRNGAPRVAVLDDQQKVQYRTVELGRDYGAEIEILSGIKAGESVVVHPGDDLPEGTAVDPVPLSK